MAGTLCPPLVRSPLAGSVATETTEYLCLNLFDWRGDLVGRRLLHWHDRRTRDRGEGLLFVSDAVHGGRGEKKTAYPIGSWQVDG